MADNSFKVKNSLNIQPIAGASPTAEGDVTYDLTAHKASLHNGTTASPVVTEAHSATLTNKTIDASNNTVTNVSMTTGVTGTLPVANGGTGSATALNNNRVIKSSSGTIVEAAAITASRALISDANGIPTHSTVTDTTLGYLDATSSVQTQLDAKIPKTLTTTTGDMIYASSANTPARLGIGASNQVLKVVGGVPSWAAAPSGGVNYLSSANDGDSIGSWVAFDDVTALTDGTGGSPTVTYAVSTNSTLRGTTNFLFTHNASDEQYQGFSYDFTIDAADKYAVLQCSVDYIVSSGTYADDDLQFWIYDVTNATLIQPAPYTLKNASIAQKFAFEFQATSSTSYRLIGHVATSTATAYTIRFDNWNLGPQAKLYGSPITDGTAYTPTFTGLGTVSAVAAFYAKEGDAVRVWGQVTAGTTAASLFTITLPSGLSANSSKVTAGDRIGDLAATATPYDGGIFASTSSPTSVYITSGSAAWDAGSNGNVWASSTKFSFNFKVPIVGWSSSVIMSSDAATNVVAASATGDPASASSGNPIIVPTVSYDTTGSYNNSTGRYTCPVPGIYKIYGALSSASSATTLTIYKNAGAGPLAGSLDSNGEATFSGSVSCVAGDVIDLRPGGTVDATSMAITFERISGPAQIAASETVAAVYQISASTGNGSVADNATEIIDYDTRVLDTHGAVTTGASWKFTAPISGLYTVSANLSWANTTNLVNGILAVYKSAAQYSWLQQNLQLGLSGSVPVRLLAGEYVDIRAFQDDSASASRSLETTASRHTVSITRVGNY